MLIYAITVLTLAVAAGTLLGLLHLRATDGATRPPVAAGVAHGLCGLIGLVLLLPVAFGPPLGAAAGAAAFGPVSAWMFAGALLSGAAILLRRRRNPAVLMAIHAGIAITGYVMLLAWYSLA